MHVQEVHIIIIFASKHPCASFQGVVNNFYQQYVTHSAVLSHFGVILFSKVCSLLGTSDLESVITAILDYMSAS